MILELILDFDYVGLTCNYVGSLENFVSRFVILACCIRRLEKPFDQDVCLYTCYVGSEDVGYSEDFASSCISCILFISACEALLLI